MDEHKIVPSPPLPTRLLPRTIATSKSMALVIIRNSSWHMWLSSMWREGCGEDRVLGRPLLQAAVAMICHNAVAMICGAGRWCRGGTARATEKVDMRCTRWSGRCGKEARLWRASPFIGFRVTRAATRLSHGQGRHQKRPCNRLSTRGVCGVSINFTAKADAAC